jgi:hypothetical protein
MSNSFVYAPHIPLVLEGIPKIRFGFSSGRSDRFYPNGRFRGVSGRLGQGASVSVRAPVANIPSIYKSRKEAIKQRVCYRISALVRFQITLCDVGCVGSCMN